MIGRLLTGGVMAMAGGYLIGVAHSSYRHYYNRYAADEDLRQRGSIQEVFVVGETKKPGRGKK
ncbi:hypothetical protein OAM96_00225 [Candidatus Poseidoniaceae archaeon]|jgi:hypothetical protein|nr:hypothetical protein [Candidatus Poseidoniaceae archaeon]|tara:strand:+ start:156 stop:344 length:189 start_codon:yes stop_codon:yes gene_type:complete